MIDMETVEEEQVSGEGAMSLSLNILKARCQLDTQDN